MTRILFLLVTLVTASAQSQTRYALRQIDFQDEPNSALVKPNTDNLAVILVDAYLNGKLTAYQVGPLDTLIQGLQFTKRSVRTTQTARKKKRVDLKKVFGKTKDAVSISTADLQPLSKSDFLKQMVIFEDEIVQWDKTTRYQRGHGLVYHKGLGYFPKKDTVGIPPPNKIYWELAYNGNLPFYYRIPELPAVTIFGEYKTTDKKEAWQPLLMRVTRTAEVPDYLVDMTVSFKYDEVMKYLTGIGQTLLYNSAYGYVGNATFVLHPVERKYLIEQVRGQAINNPAFKSKIVVTSMVGFASFLDQQDKDAEYSLFQDASAKEFRLYKQNFQVATIPTTAVEQLVGAVQTELFTCSSALRADRFNKHEIPLSGVACDLPFTETSAADENSALRSPFFLEKYSLSTVGTAEQKKMRSRLTNLIKLVNAQFKAGTLVLAEEKDSYFRARFDWSTLPDVKAKGPAISKAYWSNLLHHDDISDVRYPYYWSDNANVSYLHKKLSPLRADSLELGVTYKRMLTPDKGKKTSEPFQVSIKSLQAIAPDSNDFPVYTFNWTDLRALAVKGKDPLLVELVKLIEMGEVSWTESEVVYGVIEGGTAKQVTAKK